MLTVRKFWVKIDQNLKRKTHIEHIHSDLCKLIGILWRCRYTLPYSSKLLFYHSYIEPKINYCLQLWVKHCHNLLNKLWRLQKRAVRIICNASNDAPTYQSFHNLKILNIYEQCFYITCNITL